MKVEAAVSNVQAIVANSATRVAGLETKASLLLVIAGVITAANVSGDVLLLRIAVVLSGLSALMAVISLWPRQVKGISPSVLVKRLETHADTPYEFNLYLLGLERAASVERERSVRSRAWWLTAGFILAAVSLACVVASVLGEPDWFATWWTETVDQLLALAQSILSDPASRTRG